MFTSTSLKFISCSFSDADVTELNSGFVEREQTKSREIVASPICGTQRSLVIFLCIAVAVLLMLNVYFIHRSFGNELNVDDVVDDKNVPNTAAGWKNAYFRNQVSNSHLAISGNYIHFFQF